MRPSHSDRVPAGILFGDMKGSTASAERNEFDAVGTIREYLQLIEATVRDFSPRSFIPKSEGDGFMARFPNAHVMVECGMALRQSFVGHGWKVRLGGRSVE